MNRHVLLLLLAAPAVGSDWQKRQSEFYAKSSAERKQLGLDSNAARAKFPSPEVTFSGLGAGAGASCVAICPGKTAKVQLKGKLPQGSLVLVQSGDVEVVEERQTPGGWEATLKARPDAPPEMLRVVATSAVSAIQAEVGGLEIGCQHTVTFEVAGDSMEMKVTFPCGNRDTTANGEWRRGGKSLGAYSYGVRRGKRSLTLERQASEEEAAAAGEGMMDLMSSKEWQDTATQSNAALMKMNDCTSGPQSKVGACTQAVQLEIERVTKRREALMLENEKKNSLKFGCGSIEVEANGGSLKGEAQRCSGRGSQERVPVTGKYSSP